MTPRVSNIITASCINVFIVDFFLNRERVVSKEFMRKYIHVAKAISPVLTQEAANHIAEEYTRLRNQEQLGTDIARVRGSSNLVDAEVG